MDHSKRFFLALALLALLAPAMLVAAAPEREAVAVEYLPEAVVFDELTAAPGQTVQQEIRVPVRFHYADGTSEDGYETATFSLTSEPVLLDTITYVTCFGTLNQGNRLYTAEVNWHFNIVKGTLDDVDETHSFGNPYLSFAHNHTYLGAQGSPLFVYTEAIFEAAEPWSDKQHLIIWTLDDENSPHCNAAGSIKNVN